LYVARVFTPAADNNDGRARSAPLAGGGGRFVSRFPGSAGNGRITLRKIYQPATAQTLDRAGDGAFLRTGGANPAAPARLTLNRQAPFAVPSGAVLSLTVNGTKKDVTFLGEAAEVKGTAKVAPTLKLEGDDAARTLRVTVNDVTQTLVVDAREWTAGDLVAHLNSRLAGAQARLDGNNLVIATTRRGLGAKIQAAGPAFGFAADSAAVESGDAKKNNVPDLNAVGAAELDALLRAEKTGARAGLREGRVEIFTEQADDKAALVAGTGTANLALGLTGGQAGAGVSGPARGWYRFEGGGWKNSAGGALPGNALADGADFVTLLVETEDADGNRNSYEGLALGAAHPRYLGNVLSENPSRRADWLEQAFAFVGGGGNAHQLHDALFGDAESAQVALAGGNDGGAPSARAYELALQNLLPLEDISILAAPGHTAYAGWEGIQGVLISHAERPRAYQIAVLDTPPAQAVSGARAVRSRIDSKYAALYYPWITVPNPAWREGRDDLQREIDQPPSGFVAGIYARNDVQRGVHKAPANEVVRGALRFETDINFDEQGVLNPIGVNCLRFFPGRGYRVWGARTVSSDPEWKYVNIRRYFNYIERSIDVGTQWAVFEPNGEVLWANVRQTISSFLYNEWRNGALLGSDPKEAYFVRCDRSTMTQNDLDNGRLVCLVGVAAIKPAEFVIFRIGQKTADARD
ncbi:MAG TPA: phage tail sheath subtilisin-like domain-containing protein, partial [Longimicrobium sp.]|nr:phage tail sheath subtilisin-like domain-containing protein [Longimicrobium sp.]